MCFRDRDIASSSPMSELEAKTYYAGLPSRPVLIHRTGKLWKRPTGPEAFTVLKEVVPVFDHDIVTVWGDLGPKVCSCLDSARVTWTSVDIVRFADSDALKPKALGPPIMWIGVIPHSLSREDAHTAAMGFLELLESYKIVDVEIEFRESVFARSARPKLLRSVSWIVLDPTADVRIPLTPTLGLQIAVRGMPDTEGTGALYISEGSKVYVLSVRHVFFPRNAGNNEPYDFKNVGQPHHEVLLPGPKAFQRLLKSNTDKIRSHMCAVDDYTPQLDNMNDDRAERRTSIERKLKEAEKGITALNQFHHKVTKYWSEEDQRVIGLVAYSPPITVGTGTECYTEDWALIELDHNKIDWNNFNGNVIGLGTDIGRPDLKFTFKTRHPLPAFMYTNGHHLPLQGIIEDDELRCPKIPDPNSKERLTERLAVVKNGCATGLTIGRATGAKSFVREYFPDGTQETSMQWAILPYDQTAGAFSAPGDSGAIIVDGKGRIGGLLIGGAGKEGKDIDITYATPFYWLLQRIQARFPNARLYQHSA